MRFKNKVVLITGGSRGIGAACSSALAYEGATMAIVYKSNTSRAKKFLTSLPESEKHSLHECDISDSDVVKTLVEEVIELHGRIDILVNNAAIHEKHPIEDINYDDWIRIWAETIQTNLMAPAAIMYLVGRHMIERKEGAIINISSRGAFRGEPNQPAYGASKGGLNALTQSMAKKLGKHGIRVAAVAPCFVETEMVADILSGPSGDAIRAQSPFNRVASVEDVANAVCFLAAEKSGFCSGTIIDVNGASYLRS